MKRLIGSEQIVRDDNMLGLLEVAGAALEIAFRYNRIAEIDQIVDRLRRNLARQSFIFDPLWQSVVNAADVGMSQWVERFSHPSILMELTERNPATALNFVQLARELGGERWIERYGDKFVNQMFRPVYLKWLLANRPAEFAQMLSLARLLDSNHAAEAVQQAMFSRQHRSVGERMLLKRLPLEALSDLQWVIKTTGNNQLAEALRSILPTDA